MKKLINKALQSAKMYTLWDYACLKITLLSIGILIGTYFADFFLSHTLLLWITFLVSYFYIMFRTFIAQ
ncbi:hypothetical protein SDC9_20903 [bioreactor metagenome]|uniref:Uncharacterized protein n=1 Tax=bioreactor metagenome TaxID=1076179 RepID=A0A644U8E7_9ZZZZ|nr:hypothetical protein [Negativicutes bacterium]